MKSLFPASNKVVEKIRLDDDHTCDVYTWISPEGIKIATHMIMSCPSCSYPLSMATSEFDFESKTLNHKLKCPARWKKTSVEDVNGVKLRITDLNEKGRPIFQRCGWQGFIIGGCVTKS